MIRKFTFLFICATLSSVAQVKHRDQSLRPQGFTENKGQVIDQFGNMNNEVLFLFLGKRMNVQLKQHGFSFDCYHNEPSAEASKNLSTHYKMIGSCNLKFERVDVEFINCNLAVGMKSEGKYSNSQNFYTDDFPKVISGVQTYSRVVYPDLYPNIDLEFISNMGNFKYNFVVHPGGDIKQIRWRYKGNLKPLLTRNTIEFKNSKVFIKEEIPMSLLVGSSGDSEPIKIQYRSFKDGSFGFKAVKKITFRNNENLIIDPVPSVIWSTYFGGPGVEYISHSCIDKLGNLYMSGYTSSTVNIATAGAYQTSYAGGAHDAFILKFNSNGQLKWSTYFGRAGDDQGTYIAIDKKFNLYISGTTNSIGSIATPGAYQSSFGGGTSDAFLAKFDTSGNRIWSTYFGGTALDESYACSVDTAGSVYLSGNSASSNAISTPGAFQSMNGGGPNDAFIAKFSRNGGLIWSTYYGDYGDEQAYGCINDIAGNLYVTGETTSTVSISTPGALQTSYGGGGYDGFLLKLDTGGIRQWCTYYGGTQMDVGVGIHYDSLHHNIYVAGFAESDSSIATAGAYQTAISGGDDAFLAKFNLNGIRQWATYYGGTSYERGICVNSDSNFVYLGGLTGSSNGISTANGYQAIFGYGSGDSYLVKFDNNGNRIWGTYFGGFGYELSTAINLNSQGDIYLVGISSSPSLATVGAYQYSSSSMDGICVKFDQTPILTNVPEKTLDEPFKIFPNPNNGVFEIIAGKAGDVFIINSVGQTVFYGEVNSEAGKTIKSELPPGIYVLVRVINGEPYTQKLLITR